jgi:ABC-type transport system involved in multi-copper enzyme maturation permease subunit
MTASTSLHPVHAASSAEGLWTGFGPLFRRELVQWRRGRRFWVIPTVATISLLIPTSLAWLTMVIRQHLPPDITPPTAPASLAALDNLLPAMTTQVGVIIAILAVMNLLVGEREQGTLAWVASKPVGRGAIWLSKWAAAGLMLSLLAGLVPLGVTVVAATIMYGPPPAESVALVSLGMVGSLALFATIGLAASALVGSQAAVGAIGLAAVIVPELVGTVLGVTRWLPTSILSWSLAAASGVPVGAETPIAWFATVGLLVLIGVRQLEREEI